MSKRIVSDYVPIPRYTSLTFFRRNVLSPDDENLRSMPQENEQTKKGKALEEELKKAYSYHQKNETSCEIEYRKRLDGIIDVWIEEGDIQCTRHDLEKYLITRKVFGRHLKEKQKSLMEAYKKASSLIAKLKTQLDEEVCQVCGSFDIAFKSVFDIPLHEVLLPTKRMKELLDLELYRTSRQSLDHLQPATRGPMFAVETYTTLNCLICGALDCQTHGEFSEVINYNNENDKDEKEINFLTKPERITLQVDDLLRNHSERQANMDETESGNDTQRTRDPCSPNCHLVVGVGGEATRPLEDSDIRDISLMLVSLSYKTGRCCDIAFSLSIPCFQIFREMYGISPYLCPLLFHLCLVRIREVPALIDNSQRSTKTRKYADRHSASSAPLKS